MAPQEPNYWLMKSEPDVYGIKDLEKEKETLWDGIRNYQARNFMRKMKRGDKAFFYHSNCKPPGIVGLMEITETGLVDPTQFDKASKYFDSKSNIENPRWDCVKAIYIKEFNQKISLKELSSSFTPEELILVRKGNRLSIIPIESEVARKIMKFIKS